MFSLRILFFSLPLFFSHVFSPFGLTLGESYSFERYKVYFFIIVLALAYIEILIRSFWTIRDTLHKHIYNIGFVLILPIISALYFATLLDMSWIFGGYEKHHGYLFYTAIVCFAPLILVSSREHLRSYLNWSISAGIIVAIIAIGEYLGGVLDIYGRGEMITTYSGRTASTLGNPNYLAGYLLMILPLLTRWRAPERWIVMILIGFAILTTGSYIALFLTGLYLSYIFLRYVRFSKMISLYLTMFLAFLGLIVGYLAIDADKILSLVSRFVLMGESLSMMLQQPISFIIGFGPDSLLSHFATGRSLLIDSYFPSNMLIDSSHNIFIDILFQYGIVPLCIIGYSLYHRWSDQKEELQIAILLGGLFLALNVFVVVHIILLALLMILFARSKTDY